MSVTLPSEFRLIPARAGLNAVAVPQGRYIQAGTAILNCTSSKIMNKTFLFIISISALVFSIGCQQVSSSNDGLGNNANLVVKNSSKSVTGEPSPTPTPSLIPAANAPRSIPGATPITNLPSNNGMLAPGIPDPKAAKKPQKPGATPTPGIPDAATLKRQWEQLYGNSNKSSNAGPPPMTPAPAANAAKPPANQPVNNQKKKAPGRVRKPE
jgi:hypothetical protein